MKLKITIDHLEFEGDENGIRQVGKANIDIEYTPDDLIAEQEKSVDTPVKSKKIKAKLKGGGNGKPSRIRPSDIE